MKRVIIIVMDSVGIGALPDASLYGDEGSNTLGNIASQVENFSLPNLQKMGLGNIIPLARIPPSENPSAAYGSMAERSPGKDTTTGHWEMMGIILDKPFPTYPNGFPEEVIRAFERRIGGKVLGNKPASGTVIIEELGAEHIETGRPIVYTSADSVFQVAAHESVIPVEKLYWMCEQARDIMRGEHAVGRIIARPFIGEKGSFQRTAGRKDYSLPPPRRTVLNFAAEAGYEVAGVGKIEDIFSGSGLTKSVHIKNNHDGIEKTIKFMEEIDKGIIFTNLVDFDMLYGHRNNVLGYASALEEFDHDLVEVLRIRRDDDLLILTADHGNDPTTPSTDHSREYVPLLVYGAHIKGGVDLGIRETFADLGATVAEILNLNYPGPGTSFAEELLI